jgi:SAM-dependent methyltransferase
LGKAAACSLFLLPSEPNYSPIVRNQKKSMQDFWNARYGVDYFAYGEKPNAFVKQQLTGLYPGHLLFPAEGEGRNAVYAATLGWKVTAFDPSTEGRKKALKLAAKHNVQINYLIAGYENIDLEPESFDALVLVFAHMPPQVRPVYHRKMVSFLKPGGKLLLEGFAKEQISRNSGGPRDLSMLYSHDEMQSDFSEMAELKMEETEVLLDEGPFHQGVASVIRVMATK